MPTPPRDSNSRIAYTRWEPVADGPDERRNSLNSNNNVPFHHFEEESRPSRFKSSLARLSFFAKQRWSSNNNNNVNISSSNNNNNRNGGTFTVPSISLTTDRSSRSRPHSRCWNLTVRVLCILIVFGLGWIIGFLVRWGVHTFYIDPMGHCVTPVPYAFDEAATKIAIREVDHANISEYLQRFIRDSHHRVGTNESASYADYIVREWIHYRLEKVEIDPIHQFVPTKSKIPSEVNIIDANGTVVWSLPIPNLEVMYSANGMRAGRLVYGHFGRFSDFHNMQRLNNYSFTDTVVMIKTYSPVYHPASAVRNAQAFGARAVILFPDPNNYILTKGSELGLLPRNVSLSHSVKFVPGDPMSPYVVPSSATEDTTSTMPSIPVVSLSYEQALPLLVNYLHAKNLPKDYWYGMPFNTSAERNFTASVEVNSDMEKVELKNVIGVIPGRYEPTRYVIIGSHHDTWHQGASKPGIGHSVLMELTRVFGEMYRKGWKPGRSILFASWDGEEMGHLGSTAWLYKHSKELSSRAIAYINLDDLIQGDDSIHVTGSPIFRKIIDTAAKLVSCPQEVINNHTEKHCILYDKWRDKNSDKDETDTNGRYDDHDQNMLTSSGVSVFQGMFGVSSLELTLKNRHVTQGDAYPYAHTNLDTADKVENFLDTRHAAIAAKFLVAVLMQLVMSARLPILASDYGDSIYVGIQNFVQRHGDVLAKQKVDVKAIIDASEKFIQSSMRFQETYDPAPALTLLGHHEFNDQLLELERSFLLPATSLPLIIQNSESVKSMQEIFLSSPFRHVIHGPSPTNMAQIKYLPRLEAALEVAIAENSPESWLAVRRESFFVVDALDSAACVLDNHLVYTYPNDDFVPLNIEPIISK